MPTWSGLRTYNVRHLTLYCAASASWRPTFSPGREEDEAANPLRDALRGAISFLQKYGGFWGEDGDVTWTFEQEKANPGAPGSARIEVRVDALMDVVFAGWEEMPDVEVSQVHNQPTTIAVAGINATVRNLEFNYNLDYEKAEGED